MPGWKPVENYQGSSWKFFQKLKTVYGKYLEDVSKVSNNKSDSVNTYYEIESLKNRNRDRRRNNTLVRNILIGIGLSLLFYLLYTMWTSGPTIFFR